MWSRVWLPRRALGIIYFSNNPLPSVTYQLLSCDLMAQVNLSSWGKGKLGCVVEIKFYLLLLWSPFFCEHKQDVT